LTEFTPYISTQPPADVVDLTYAEAIALRNETHWRELSSITIHQAFGAWILTIKNKNTRDAYTRAFAKFVDHKLLDPNWTLQALALLNGEAIVDQVKQLHEYSEATRQSRAAALIAFSRFLHRRTGGLIKRIVPSHEGTSKTFYRVRKKVATQAMSQAQWTAWLEHLKKISHREWLIARVTLQGGKRISETLALTSDWIDTANNRIRFQQLKTKGTLEETVITYPETVIRDLLTYLGGRQGLVFVTKGGRPVDRNAVAKTFVLAGERAKIPFRTTPHTLRASCITYLRMQGFPDSEIMGVTGHASAEMVAAYDKRSSEQNASAKVTLAQ
jgi:integrase/recombinase XerD